MTYKTYPRAFRALPLFLVLVSALAVSKSVAQEEDEVYELSPFSVEASDQSGYTATHTLAGTRIRTQLKDLGSAISVYTGKFMEDTGATDAGTLLSYTTNAEVGGINGNFSGAQDNGRGRFLVTEARIRFDNHGSLRSEFDINRTLVEDRVALRIAGLDDHVKYRQKPAWNRDRRIYAALDAVLSKDENSDFLGATRFKANYEEGQSKGSPIEIIPPTAAYHSWFEPAPASIAQYTGLTPDSNHLDPADGGTWEFQTTYNPFVSVNGSSENEINTNTHPTAFRTIPITFSQPDAQKGSATI